MDVTLDRLLDGAVTLRQAADGYRAGLDAALLAAACDAGPGARVLEAGCGVGGVLLSVAWRRPGVALVGLEKDAAAVALARSNARENDLEARVRIVEGDVGAGFAVLAEAPFDAVLANPPFFDSDEALRGPAPAKRAAWITPEGLTAWTGFMLAAARDGGVVTLIHRADRLADLLAGLAPKAGSFRIRPVQPFADADAKRVLVRAVKGGRAPLRLLPPLVLHERGGPKHTPAAEAILRGRAELGWA